MSERFSRFVTITHNVWCIREKIEQNDLWQLITLHNCEICYVYVSPRGGSTREEQTSRNFESQPFSEDRKDQLPNFTTHKSEKVKRCPITGNKPLDVANGSKTLTLWSRETSRTRTNRRIHRQISYTPRVNKNQFPPYLIHKRGSAP